MVEIRFYQGYLTVKMIVQLKGENTYNNFTELAKDVLVLTDGSIVDKWDNAVAFTLPNSKFIYSFNSNDYEILLEEGYVETEAMTETRYLEFITAVGQFGVCDTGYLI